MKKLFTLLSLFLCFASGAWAINTNGAMNGVFSISSTKKVVFSQGNLQWSGTNGWRFASNQWDIIGSKANNTSPTSSNDNYMDLFCWGATGLNGVAPNTADSYLSGSSVLSGNNDWGTNMGASWRTLTSDEWAYLFNTRASGSTVNGTSNARYAFATIRTDINSGINGIILFPDGVNFAASEFTTLGTVNGVSSYATKCTSDQWTALEGKGCVFLPAAGLRSGSTVSDAGVHGCYWSSSPYASYEADKAYDVYFGNVLSLPRDTRRFFGSSVRLVKDYQLQQDSEGYYLLGTAQDWKDFAGIVNNTNPAANAKMTADIDLGDDQTHIGDNNDLSYAYRGVFDGQGHKLNVNYYSSSPSADVEGGYSIAPFRNIKGATIKNLAVTGNITGYMHCAGVVGYAVSPSTNLINNVTVSANITILNTHGGGFIGHNEYATTTIQDCLFNGTINGKSGGSTVGVFFGWSGSSATMSLINCLENGSYTNCSTFTPTSCPGYAVPTVTNCYYAVTGSYPGTQATSAQLADGTIATALQNGRAEEIWVQDPVTNQPMLEIFANKISYTVPSSGIGTFSANTAVVLPEGLEAYVCKTYDSGKSTISTQKVEGTIPANTGVLMKGIGGETYTLVASSQTPEAIEGNALIAVVEATHVDQIVGEYTNFMMSGGKFVKIAASSNPNDKIPANRAYLPILTSALPAGSGQSITVNWDEETGVKAVRNAQFMVNSYYTLDGRKLNGAPSKGGVYINNGKKVIK